MKKVIIVGLSLVLILVALSGCAGNSTNDNSQGNKDSTTNSEVNNSTSKTSAAAKSTVSENLNALNSNGQSIENMLKGIADDYANITISDSQSSDAESMANQLNSYLDSSTDNISGLN